MRTPPHLLSNIAAFGGDGGGMFDSGCNLSGVKKVRIECGYMKHNGTKYMNTIKRIWLDFHTPSLGEDVIFHGYAADGTSGWDKFIGAYNTTFTFELGGEDQIVKIVVWSDGILANAVQFHTEMGIISPMYGMPATPANSFTFQGRCDSDSRLVGVHGRFGGAIDKLGFSFATFITVGGTSVATESSGLESTTTM
jgi:hypothetical protein